MRSFFFIFCTLVLSTVSVVPLGHAAHPRRDDVLEGRGFIIWDRPEVPSDRFYNRQEPLITSQPFVSRGAEVFSKTRAYNTLGRTEVVRVRPDRVPETDLFKTPQ